MDRRDFLIMAGGRCVFDADSIAGSAALGADLSWRR